MSDAPQQEMTLQQWVERLPASHRAHLEYLALVAARPPIAERGACHDAAERDEGCFRALKAERELADAKAQLNAGMLLSAPSATAPSAEAVQYAKEWESIEISGGLPITHPAFKVLVKEILRLAAEPTETGEQLPPGYTLLADYIAEQEKIPERKAALDKARAWVKANIYACRSATSPPS